MFLCPQRCIRNPRSRPVTGGHVRDHEALLGLDMAEADDFIDYRRFEFILATAGMLSMSPTVANNP
jgi:hypothetical protein